MTPDDVRRWDPAAVLKVFQVANNRAGTLQTFGDNLGQVGQNLADWEGEAGAAFQGSLGRARPTSRLMDASPRRWRPRCATPGRTCKSPRA